MAKKFFPKALSVGLSLALCAGMVAPAFAASFTDLQNAIDGNDGGKLIEDTGRYGYAEKEDGTFGIEAWDANGTRNVTLNEDVDHEDGDADGGIVISGKGTNVTLNMNGNTIDLNPGSTLDIESETFKDEAGNEVVDANVGAVITVRGGAALTINGAGNDGEKGIITGGNHATPTLGAGGGIVVSTGTVNLSDVSVEGNKAVDGGGIYVSSASGKASVTTDGVSVSGNVATNIGGGIHVGTNNKGTVTLNDTEVTGNKASTGGGMGITKAVVSVDKDSVIANNISTVNGDDIATYQGTLTMPDAEKMTDENGNSIKLNEDDKPINGWYFDGGTATDSGWGGNGKYAYYKYENINGTYKGWAFLKAAHDQYFNVVYTDGVDGDVFDSQAYEVENKNPVPVFNGEIPERPGYTFAGWLVDGENFDPATGTVTGTLTLVAAWTQNPAVVDPETPDLPDDTGETELDDQAVPLAAGPVTRAEFIDYLWRHEGEPASDGVCTFTDVAEDHEYVLALAWAEQNGIAEAYLNAEGHEDGTFEPDELVSAGDVREFLGNFAQVFGTNAVAVDELTTLASDDGEAVLNCDEVLAQFFGEEYTSAKDQDDQLDPAA